MSMQRKQFDVSAGDVIRASRARILTRSTSKPEDATGRTSADGGDRSGDWIDPCAHDLRGVLGAADGYAQLLEMSVFGAIPDRQQQELTRIRGLLRKAFGIVDEIELRARHSSPR